MPLCVHCGRLVDSLYSVYGEATIVCTKCPVCRQFADPYLEHDALLVVLDLLLVKPRVYRHLLFNRNCALGPSIAPPCWSAWLRLVRYLLAVVLVDSYLRWTALYTAQEQSPHHGSSPLDLLIHKFVPYAEYALVVRAGTLSDLKPVFCSYALVAMATAIETLAYHGIILISTYVARRLTPSHRVMTQPHHSPACAPKPDSVGSQQPSGQGEVDQDLPIVEQGTGADNLFEITLVPWALILSALTPLLLLLLNFLWRFEGETAWNADLTDVGHAQGASDTSSEWLRHVSLLFADQTEFSIDWVARTLIGGVSAGVALGVTTVLILCAATYVQTALRYTLHNGPAVRGL